jgi:hypothetical protein
MRRLIRLILAFTMLGASFAVLQAQTDERQKTDEYHTKGFLTGRMWNELSEGGKVMYINGLLDGQDLSVLTLQDNKISKQIQQAVMYYADGYRVDDYVKTINAFYKEPANVRVPMLWAYKYASTKLKGASEAKLNELVANYRQQVAQAKE